MSNRIRCSCQRCTIRGLMGPAILITIGILFLLSEMHGGYLDFVSYTWPVILIVVGAISLGSSLASMEGHLSSTGAPPVAPGTGATPQAPGSSIPGQGQP